MPTTTNNGWTTPADSDPFKDGALAIRTLGNGIDTSVGTGLLAWTAYTPTFSGITIGNGTVNFKYAKLGKTVHVRGVFTFGTTSALTTTVDIGLPFNSVAYPFAQCVGNFNTYSSLFAGSMVYVGSSSNFRCVLYNTAGTFAVPQDLSTTVPYGAGNWNTGKQIMVSFTYEAA